MTLLVDCVPSSKQSQSLCVAQNSIIVGSRPVLSFVLSTDYISHQQLSESLVSSSIGHHHAFSTASITPTQGKSASSITETKGAARGRHCCIGVDADSCPNSNFCCCKTKEKVEPVFFSNLGVAVCGTSTWCLWEVCTLVHVQHDGER